MAEGKVGVVIKSIVFFSFYMYIALFLRIVSVHFCVRKIRQIYLL